MTKRKKKITLNSEIAAKRELAEAEELRNKEKLRKELKKEVKQDIKDSRRRKKEFGQRVYDESPDIRTEEQIELSRTVHEEVMAFVKDKFLYSKFGNKMYPHVIWRRFKENRENCPREKIRVVEKEVIREIVKPNKTYYNYADDKDPVPEEVIVNGYKEILAAYGVDFLDDYTVRKLFYHTILSLAHYLDLNPEFYLKLQDLHVYREPLQRNVMTFIIPKSSVVNKGTTVDTLYNYFVGGDMDIEALQQTLDVFALSFIEYTESKKPLRDKARESYNRYKLISELTEQAKEMLRAQGIVGGKGYRTLVNQLRTELREQYRMQQRQRIKKFREEDEQKRLTNDLSCGIIKEQEETTEEQENKNKPLDK